MTQRYFAPDLTTETSIRLIDEEAKHANVMRIQVGDLIVCFDGAGFEVNAEVIAINRKECLAIPVSAPAIVERELAIEVHLAVALPKGDRQKFLVEKAVELGAVRLIPLLCTRSVVRPDAGSVPRLRRAVIEASKQCGRNRLMHIDMPTELHQLLSSAQGHRLIADPSFPQGLSKTLNADSVCVLIGPEGGFTEAELLAAENAGWMGMNLGKRILRVETAALAVLAKFEELEI